MSKTPFTEGIVLSENFHLLALPSNTEKKNLIMINPYLTAFFFNVNYSSEEKEGEK